MSSSEFNTNARKLKAKMNELEQELENRGKQQQSNLPTNQIDAEIRGLQDRVQIELNNLQNILVRMQAAPVESRSAVRERNAKNEEYQELLGRFNFLKNRIENDLNPTSKLFPDKKPFFIGEDGEADETRNKSNQELRTDAFDQFHRQNDKLKSIHGHVKNIHYLGEDIHEEVNEHNELLDNLEDNVDEGTADMVEVNSKLTYLMKKSKSCCLWIIIIIEIIALILIAVFPI